MQSIANGITWCPNCGKLTSIYGPPIIPRQTIPQQTAKETWYGIEDTKDNTLLRDRGNTLPYMRKLKTTAEREIKRLCADNTNNTNRFKVVHLHILAE